MNNEKPRTFHNPVPGKGGKIMKAPTRRFNFGPGGAMKGALAASKTGK